MMPSPRRQSRLSAMIREKPVGDLYLYLLRQAPETRQAEAGLPEALATDGRQQVLLTFYVNERLEIDGNALISGGRDRSIWHWNSGTLGEGDNLITTSGNRVATLDRPHDHAPSVVMMPDGEHVVAGASDGSVWLCFIRGTKRLISKHNKPAIAVAMSSEASLDSTVLASASEDEWTIQAYPCPHDHVGVEYAHFCLLLPPESTVFSVVFSHDGNKLATGCNGRVHVFGVETGRELYMLEHPNVKRTTGNNHVRTISFSTGDDYLATGAEDGVIRLWDTGSRTVLKSFDGHEEILSLVLFFDGRTMASCGSDNTVRLWKIIERTMASCGSDDQGASGTLSIRSGSFEAPFGTRGWHGSIVDLVAWSSNGIINGSLDGTVKRWQLRDLSTLECVGHFKGHRDFVLSAVEDNTLILSGSEDCNVGLWDPVIGEQVLLVPAHNNSVISVASSCQPGYFATGSVDGARVWFYRVRRRG
ncbi:hypothetical protein Purlil1_12727 [Purpureocillium lilacinum]|uniref:Mitochondrial division protein 1 n=1 Tax=Purpureocillium lilacinum TaxID=33203 RepID=A0ABR0BGN1_PURLI|nr:hypothetical protein Purlil1_12727 [Purpureocillium lilacinum]